MKIYLQQLSATLFLLLASLPGFAQNSTLPQQKVPDEYGYKIKTGEQIPNITLNLINGETVTTADMKGKVVMLQFTASWCSVCRKEMPHIENRIWQKHKNNPDFMLIGIDMDEPPETVKKFAQDMKITYPLALDPEGKHFYTFAHKGAGVTRNIIIDKTGKIVFLTRLFKEDEFNAMISVIETLLKGE